MLHAKYSSQGVISMYRGVLRRCQLYSEHNEFLGVLDEEDYDEKRFQKIISAIDPHKKCSNCNYHCTIIETDYIPANQFKLAGTLKRDKRLEILGVLMLGCGVITLIGLLSVLFYSNCVLGPLTVFENIASQCNNPKSLFDKDLTNYLSAVSVYFVGGAIMIDRSSNKLAKVTGLFAAFSSILVFMAGIISPT